jgi:hypothetical protein
VRARRLALLLPSPNKTVMRINTGTIVITVDRDGGGNCPGE